MTKPDTRHLDTAISIFRSDKGKRAKQTTTFILQVFNDHAILQGARGKTVRKFDGTPDETRAAADRYVSSVPGATVNSFWND
jgi:hypothetical protein